MLKSKYRSFLKDGIFKSQVWMAIASAMLLANVMLSFKIMSMETAEKTVIHPMSMTEEYAIEGGDLDPNYVNSLSEEFLQGRLTYNPKTVATQFDRLAKHFHPSIYGEKKAELDVEAERIIKTEETSVFFPMNVHIKSNIAYIEGEVNGYLGKKLVSQSLTTYEVEYRQSGGRVWLFNWREVELNPGGKEYQPVESSEQDELAGVR